MWLYLGFIGFVIAMLVIDLRFFHRDSHVPTTKESGAWVTVWVGMAVGFGVLLLASGNRLFGDALVDPHTNIELAALYFSAYLVEYSLSVDNMFVFLVVFAYFKVGLENQRRVLFFGILGAMVFRGIFIAAGVAIINRFEWVLYLFGALLIFTAYRIAKGTEDVDPSDNPVLKLAARRLPLSHRYDGQKFVTLENGKRLMTPLVLVLIVIETTDIVFAVDSIPAALAITTEPFLVLTSNVFAILGLRALYFLLAGSMNRFHLLKYGLAVILAFVGMKMLLAEVWHPEIWVSLSVIVAVLGATVIASLAFPVPVTTEHLEVPEDNPFLDEDEDESSKEGP
ncbi:MAG: TerC family protein [Actinobacteria bacterium]|nr:TerC family protein [Actinomycetota bacterium]